MFNVAVLPSDLTRPLRFTHHYAGGVKSLERSFHHVTTGFAGTIHLRAELFQSPASNEDEELFSAYQQISIVDADKVASDLVPPISLHPERHLLSSWFLSAKASPKSLWIRHLPVFIRSSFFALSKDDDQTPCLIVFPDSTLAQIRGPNGSPATTAFDDAAVMEFDRIGLDAKRIGQLPPLRPYALEGHSRPGQLTRLEALLGAVSLIDDDGKLVFDPELLSTAFGVQFDALMRPADRDAGLFQFPIVVGDHCSLDRAITFTLAVVTIGADASLPALRVSHFKTLRIEPDAGNFNFVDEVLTHLRDESCPLWSGIEDNAVSNNVPLVVFDETGALIGSSDQRLSGFTEEAMFVFKDNLAFDLAQGAVRAALYDDPKNTFSQPTTITGDGDERGRPEKETRGTQIGGGLAIEAIKAAVTGSAESPSQPEEREGVAIEPIGVASRNEVDPQNASDDDSIPDDVWASPTQPIEMPESADGDGIDVPGAEDEANAEGDSGDEGQGDTSGATSGGVTLAPPPRPPRKRSNVMAQRFSIIEADARKILREIVANNKKVKQADIDQLLDSPRRSLIAEQFVLIASDPASYLKQNAEIAPREHNDLASIERLWHSSALVRTLSVIAADIALGPKWEPGSPASPAKLHTAMKTVNKWIAEAEVRLGRSPSSSGGLSSGA